jgi:oligopeptide transport system permease protein
MARQTQATDPIEAAVRDERRPPGFFQRLARGRTALMSLAFIIGIVLAALVGPAIYRVDPTHTDFKSNNAPPSTAHVLGTDRLGHDTLARLLAGLRVSLLVAAVVETINILIGAPLGLLAGYFGGWIDIVISRLADVFFAFPGLLLAILVAAVFGQAVTEQYGSTARLVLVAGSLSLVGWPLMARYVRGQVLSLRERDFILAAQAIGQSKHGILQGHIFPNVAGLVITAATLDVVNAIVGEATLSLLGLGIQAPATSIGKMIVEATPFLAQNPILVFVPSVTLTLLVLAFSFLGDGMRRAFDPAGR